MKDIVEKLAAVEKRVSEEKGPFSLYALFLREDAPDKWDLVVSAPWFHTGDKKTLDYLTGQIQSSLKPHERIMLSRVVVVEPTDRALSAIHRAVNIEHGDAEVKDSSFFGLPIKHAYIITSQKVDANAKQPVK